MNKEEFIKEMSMLKIDLTEEQLNQFDKYYKLLIQENDKYNLTNITEEKSVYLKHFYDSATITKAIDLNNKYICDIGTGAGFPGIVLKILFPSIKIDLLDATTKKCNFLKMVIDELKLDNIKVINMRAEDYSVKVREKYDIVTSRAVAPLKHLLEYSIPLLKIDGHFIALKSNISEELININNYYKKLFLQNESIIEFKLPYEESKRTIYMVKKIKETSKKYPRKYNLIKKKEI